MTMTLVSTVTVGAGGAASIQFASIPQTGTDLLIVLSYRDTFNDGTLNINSGFRVNNDSSSTYSVRVLRGSGSAASSTSFTSTYAFINSQFGQSSATTTNTFGNAQIYIPNYTSATAKSYSAELVSENNAASAGQHIVAGSIGNTSAISTLELFTGFGSSFAQYSTASLHTITKGSGGATVS